MSKQLKKTKEVTPLAPEDVILQRRKMLCNQEEIQSFFFRLILMIILCWVIFGYVFGITRMENNDMMPRISSGDLLLYYRLENDIHNQDVIVFEKNNEQYVGRIVARGGDIVEITDDAKLKINDSVVLENDIYYSTPQYQEGVTFPFQVEENAFFVLCDYREGAKDSRFFGSVSETEIKGKVITVIRRSGL